MCLILMLNATAKVPCTVSQQLSRFSFTLLHPRAVQGLGREGNAPLRTCEYTGNDEAF